MCYCGRICPGNCISTSTMSKPMPIVEGLRQQLLSNEDWFAMCRSIQSDASLLLVTTTGFIIDASAMASLTPGVNNLMLPGLSIESVIHPSDWDLLMSEFSLITMFDKPMFNLTLRFAGAFGCYHWLDVSGLVMKTKEMILVAMSTRPYINPSLDSMSPAPPPAEEDSMLNCLDERLAHGFRAVLTSDLDFIKVSPACYFVIGFSPYELLGSNLRQFVCDASVFDFGNNSHFSFLIRTRTGASIPCIMTTQMATTGNNTIMINANINLILDPQQPALLGMTADQLPLAASSKPRQVIRKSSLDPQEQDDYMGMDTRSSLPHDYLSSSAEETVPFDAFGARNHLAASRAALLVAAPILPSSPRANIPQNSFFEGNGGAYVKSEGIELPSSPRSRGSSRSSSPRPSSPAFIHKPQKRAYKNEPKVIADRECESCHTTVSPEWRRGPLGPKSLCNACGLQFAKMHRISPVQAIFSMKQSSPPTSPRRSSSASDLEQNQMQQTRPYKMPSSSAAMRRPKSAPSLTLTEDMFSANYPFTQDASSEIDSEKNE